ncbi:MAG: Hpt domain-containing protein [Myxococcota bacterium]
MAISERLRQRLAALRETYIETFGEEAAGLRAEIAEFQSSGGRSALKSRAHRLAGTAGSYSLEAVFNAASALERVCDGGGDEVVLSAAEALRDALEAHQ